MSFHCRDIRVISNIPLDCSVVCCLASNLITQAQQMYHLHGLACGPHCQALVESSYKKKKITDPLLSLGAQTMIKLFLMEINIPPPLPPPFPNVVYSIFYFFFLQASIFTLLLISSNIFW